MHFWLIDVVDMLLEFLLLGRLAKRVGIRHRVIGHVDVLEDTVDLRQNQEWDLSDMPAGGEYQWQVVPLNLNFQQICPESPLWLFHKDELPPTPTTDPNLGGTGSLPGSP